MDDPRTSERQILRGSSCFPLDLDAKVSVKNTARCELRTWSVGFRTFRHSHQERDSSPRERYHQDTGEG